MEFMISVGTCDFHERLRQVKLNFDQDAWERKVKEACIQSRFCRRKSFTFALTVMDVISTWHRDGGEELPHWVEIYIHEKLRK